MNFVRAGLRAAEVHLKLEAVNPVAYLGSVMYPLLLTAIGLIELSQGTASGRVAYAILGGGLAGLWGMIYVSAGLGIDAERWGGTLEQLMGSPTPLAVIMVGKLLASGLMGLVAILLSLLLAVLVFHRLLPPVDPLPFAVSFLLTFVAFFALALGMAPAFPMARWAFTIVNGTEMLVLVICGFMFPISQLPQWVQWLAGLLPPTWTIRALYASTGQPVGRNYGVWWVTAILLSLIYVAIAIAAFRIVEVRSRVSGQLASA